MPEPGSTCSPNVVVVCGSRKKKTGGAKKAPSERIKNLKTFSNAPRNASCVADRKGEFVRARVSVCASSNIGHAGPVLTIIAWHEGKGIIPRQLETRSVGDRSDVVAVAVVAPPPAGAGCYCCCCCSAPNSRHANERTSVPWLRSVGVIWQLFARAAVARHERERERAGTVAEGVVCFACFMFWYHFQCKPNDSRPPRHHWPLPYRTERIRFSGGLGAVVNNAWYAYDRTPSARCPLPAVPGVSALARMQIMVLAWSVSRNPVSRTDHRTGPVGRGGGGGGYQHF